MRALRAGADPDEHFVPLGPLLGHLSSGAGPLLGETPVYGVRVAPG
ncbi:hypothetical protein QFZ22_000893 [Streptomyces canus]|uniref:Uncharacterized protein n=1 Tax=Streptomyces canus TaxID=58343 RepID=A0AAW8F5X7_9ACTN|nr:hypothetical protein [Streptomyces canus]MDQ0904908.1 hypothetical protein [Streptomyces canus]